jgi:hypothetical protein
MSTSTTPLSTPRVPGGQAELLERIDARLERIEARLAKLDPLLDAAPGLVAILGDTFDEAARELGDLDDRLRAALALLERATRPNTLAQLEAGFELLESAPGLIAILGDTFDEFARAAAARGLELERIVPELGRALESVLGLLTHEQIQELLESDLLLPSAIEVLSTAARSLAAASQAPVTKVGLFGALGALRQPEVQRALGFTLDIARRFGTSIDRAALPPASQATATKG